MENNSTFSAGYQKFHAGVVIRSIDQALKTEPDKHARLNLTNSRRYMVHFLARHPSGAIPRQMDELEFWLTAYVLSALKHWGVRPPKDHFN